MSYWKVLSACTLGAGLFAGQFVAPAQIVVGIGAAPMCPYGYYDYAPYDCSPYGYYGPDWFSGGLFIGAGPWFRGGLPWADAGARRPGVQPLPGE